MIKFLSSITVIFVTLFPLSEGWALRQYRCSGQVQYRPCNDNRAIPALKTSYSSEQKFSTSTPMAQMRRGFLAPVVFSTSYRYSKEGEVGIWNGYVQGEGPVVLHLRLNSQGSPPEVRYMGKAVLRGRPSPFEFRSVPPKIGRWNWHISAKNEVQDAGNRDY